MTVCEIQLIASSIYIACFLTAVVYMLAINQCKFNKRTKVVIIFLGIAMSFGISSSILSYIDESEGGTCGVFPVSYTTLS